MKHGLAPPLVIQALQPPGDFGLKLHLTPGHTRDDIAPDGSAKRRQANRRATGEVARTAGSPSLEAAVRIAQTFNITLDYLLIPDAPRRPLRSASGPIDARLRLITGNAS